MTVDGQTILVMSYPAGDSYGFAALTSAEDAVLRSAIGGLSNAEIAAQRARSVSTIEKQLASAFHKLGVGTRAEAALLLRGKAR